MCNVVASSETEPMCHIGNSNYVLSSFQKVQLKGPALLFLPTLHPHTFLKKYFSSEVMEGAVVQGRCDVEEAEVQDGLTQAVCDSKK